MTFRDSILRLGRPGFLSPGPSNSQPSIGQGGRFLYGIGLVLDAMAEHLRQGTLARMPGYGTPTAHPYLGRDRGIRKGFAASDDVYAVQLQKYLDAWRGAGNPWTLLEQIAAYLTPYPTKLRTVDNSGNWYTLNADGSREIYQQTPWNWDSDSNVDQATQWARFWVIIYADTFLSVQPNWGDAAQWGGAWGTDNKTWGTSATPDQIQDLKDMVSRWRPAHAKEMTLILAFDNTSFDPEGSGLPDGKWGRWSKKVAGVRVKSRLDTARYITINE